MAMEAEGEVRMEKTRIYVGGLGAAVTEDDLRKTFSALGEVAAVDVVRTKGRSFAYLDFLPSSHKSLPKLFSTYNGCMWKGGRLRLEKAKEHYLLRMRREWQQDLEQASKPSTNDVNPSESHNTFENPKKLSSSDKAEKFKLNLFFPKLQKVKSLATVGVGKHKYSFQRIQVPSVPAHFCDCEEHSRPFLATNEKRSSELENGSHGINEEELNIMNSVMNKIFEREKPSKPAFGKSELVNEMLDVDSDEEDHLTDEDNLIINVVAGDSNMTDLLGEMKTILANQEPRTNKLRTSSNSKPKTVQKNQKTKNVPLKKRKSPYSEENDINDMVIPETSKSSHINLNNQEDIRPELESGTKKSGSNSFRSKKSTWKDLIGQNINTQFSISDVISTVPQEKEEPMGDDNRKKILLRNKKRKSDVVDGDLETTSTELGFVTQQFSVSDILPEASQEKEEEPRTNDHDMPSTIIDHQFSISDILPEPSQKNEEEPRTSDLDMPLTTIDHQFTISDIVLEASQKNEEEPRTSDLDMPSTTIDHQFTISDILPDASQQKEPRTDDLEMPLISSMENNKLDNQLGNKDLIRVARGDAWRHKSSWTQLISNTNNSNFSISQVVPNLSFEKHEKQVDVADNVDLKPANKNLDTTSIGKEECLTSLPVNKKTLEQRRIVSLGNLESEDTCPFMRTEASMKEWKKAKAALSSSLNKKKRSVKDSV